MAYLLQIACVTLLAELLMRLVPVRSAGFRYAYWRLVLVGALLAPWLLRTTIAPAEITFVPIAAATTVLDASLAGSWRETGPAWMNLPWMALAPWLLLAGIVVRVAWVGAGVRRLRAWRRAGEPVADPFYEEVQQRLGTRAELRSVAAISQPVTFGLRRPVVLLPESLQTSADAIRRAVITHELVHVRRRDWLWVLGEEMLRAALWFHPAIWWITSRIRLTREEFTDHIAVLASGSRRQYMEALLAFADTVPPEPAPAFARRAHLFHRITLLSMEPAMSARRVVLSGAIVTMLLAAGGWYASEVFPVVVEATPAGPQAATAAAAGGPQAALRPITPENPIPRRVFATPIAYPLELNGTAYEGVVELRVVLGANGAVADVQRGAVAVTAQRAGVTLTPNQAMDSFAAAAADAVRRWAYDPPASAPIAFYVGVSFSPNAPAAVSQSDVGRGVTTASDGVRLLTPGQWTVTPGGRAVGGPGQPRPVVPAAPGSVDAGGGGRSGGAAGARPVTPLAVPPPPPPPPPPPGERPPLRIGGAIRPPLQVRKVAPVYPEIARSAKVTGVVILEVRIDEQGNVHDPRVLRSIPLLDQAAIDAVRQWQYEPVLLNGAPVPVIMTVTVDFRLEF